MKPQDECKHEHTYTTDIGFVMCSKCEKIIEVPTLGDLWIGEYMKQTKPSVLSQDDIDDKIINEAMIELTDRPARGVFIRPHAFEKTQQYKALKKAIQKTHDSLSSKETLGKEQEVARCYVSDDDGFRCDNFKYTEEKGGECMLPKTRKRFCKYRTLEKFKKEPITPATYTMEELKWGQKIQKQAWDMVWEDVKFKGDKFTHFNPVNLTNALWYAIFEARHQAIRERDAYWKKELAARTEGYPRLRNEIKREIISEVREFLIRMAKKADVKPVIPEAEMSERDIIQSILYQFDKKFGGVKP